MFSRIFRNLFRRSRSRTPRSEPVATRPGEAEVPVPSRRAALPPMRAPLFGDPMARGRKLLAEGNTAGARAAFEAALADDPLSGPAHAALAELDRREGRIDSAVAHYRTVVARHSDLPALLDSFGALLVDTGDFGEAARLLTNAAELDGDLVPARENLARALFNLRRFDEAERQERWLVARDPDAVALHLRLARLLLLQGKFDEGFGECEWRLRTPGFEWGVRGLPRWEGGSSVGKRLLAIAEPGLGETILFARFVPELAARGAHIEFLVPAVLERLFRSSFASENVHVTVEATADVAHLDAQVHLMSLGHHLSLARGALAARTPYLRVDEGLASRWAEEVRAHGGFRVGIAWAGNPQRPGGEGRSLAAGALAPLANAVPGATWFNLQRGLAADAPWPFAMVDLMPEVEDFADTAAILGALDVVVSADTSVAHAAAALGRPLVLLAAHEACWHWEIAGEPSPWYPGVHMLTAEGPNRWERVVDAAGARLGELALTARDVTR